MRSAASWTVASAIAVIALLAALDAFQGTPKPVSARSSERPRGVIVLGRRDLQNRAALVAELRAAGVEGFLYFTDRRCQPWSLGLPELEWGWRESERATDCRFALSPDGRRAIFGDAVWHPFADLGAVDRSSSETEQVELSSQTSGWRFRFTGSRPTFRPDGTLTFVREGELWEWSDQCAASARTVVFRVGTVERRCARVMLSKGDLRRIFSGRWPFPRLQGRVVREAAWLDEERVVVLVEGDSGQQILAVLADGRVRAVIGAFGVGVRSLEASPRGTHVAARMHGEVLLLNDRLRTRSGNPGGVHSVAWSPDERFAALASSAGVSIVAPGDSRRPIVIPISALDLAWGPQGEQAFYPSR